MSARSKLAMAVAPAARHARMTRSSRFAALAFTAAFIAGCGGAPSATPTALPTAAATPVAQPTATPFDVGAAFLARIADPGFAARIDLDGTMEMGVTVTMGGVIEGSGEDSRQSMTVTIGSVSRTTETISIGSNSWSRTLPGPWLAVTAARGNTSLTTWLGTLGSLNDVGIESKNGVSLHHLRPAGGSKVPADVLGLDPAQFANPDISIELYALDDGTPALFEVSGSWVQAVGGQQVNVELAIDMTVTKVGQPVTITAPMDVWTPYTSELGYSAAHPADFTVTSDAEGDTFQRDGVDWFYVFPYAEGKGLTAEGFRDAILEIYAKDPGAPREDPIAVSVAGGPAFKAVFELKGSDGGDLVLVDILTVHGDLGWEISLVTTPSLEAVETKVFEAFLATFKFAK